MIQCEHEYLDYIQRNGVGAKDNVASTPASYVSYLNGASRLLGMNISPDLLHSEDDIERVLSKLNGTRARGTIRNYGSAMRQYVAMVRERALW